MEIEEIYSKGRRKVQVEVRDLLCCWAVLELGISCTALAKQLKISQPGVGYTVNRGKRSLKNININYFDKLFAYLYPARPIPYFYIST